MSIYLREVTWLGCPTDDCWALNVDESARNYNPTKLGLVVFYVIKRVVSCLDSTVVQITPPSYVQKSWCWCLTFVTTGRVATWMWCVIWTPFRWSSLSPNGFLAIIVMLMRWKLSRIYFLRIGNVILFTSFVRVTIASIFMAKLGVDSDVGFRDVKAVRPAPHSVVGLPKAGVKKYTLPR